MDESVHCVLNGGLDCDEEGLVSGGSGAVIGFIDYEIFCGSAVDF